MRPTMRYSPIAIGARRDRACYHAYCMTLITPPSQKLIDSGRLSSAAVLFEGVNGRNCNRISRCVKIGHHKHVIIATREQPKGVLQHEITLMALPMHNFLPFQLSC